MHTSSYANELLAPPVAAIWLEAAAEIQEFCAHWDRSRAGRPMPRRGDIDFAEIAGAFAGVLLAERLPGSEGPATYRYLPIDTLEDKEHAGIDPALFQHIPISGCHTATETGAPHLEQHSLLSGDGVLLDYDIIFLPLAAAGGSDADVVEGLLVFAVELLPVA
ncbi:MAG: hypothetical protein IPK59_15035 [Rhodospirillaceae bacterium]|nr:hypothetical protein [Rhodospirillaceae bacterium]